MVMQCIKWEFSPSRGTNKNRAQKEFVVNASRVRSRAPKTLFSPRDGSENKSKIDLFTTPKLGKRGVGGAAPQQEKTWPLLKFA